MQTPSSRRAFLRLLTGSTALLVAACGALPSDPKAANPNPALPPPPAPAPPAPVQPRPAVEVAPAVEIAAPSPTATTPPPTATPVPPTATRVPPTATPVPPTATPVPPTPTPEPTTAPTEYDPARLKFKLGEAQTSYAGSIPERAWNVELAAERLNGTVVAPGELFSFNKAVGPTTLNAGFRIGYGITMSNSRPLTIPSVAGGICQVATTVFQAAYWAGLPFEERHYHLYWISRYGQPPSGQTGFDATVDDPGVDLKFRNTTDDFIRLESWVDGENVGFVIQGADPGWQVETVDHRIYNVVKTSQAPVRQEDYTLPPGRELWVEHAEDGFTLSATRLVKTKDGELVDEYAFTNRYLPSRNVLLVGAIPRPRVAAPAPEAPPPETDPAAAVPIPGPAEPTPAPPSAAPSGPQPSAPPGPQPSAPAPGGPGQNGASAPTTDTPSDAPPAPGAPPNAGSPPAAGAPPAATAPQPAAPVPAQPASGATPKLVPSRGGVLRPVSR